MGLKFNARLPTERDFEADPQWSWSVYWHVVGKALLAIVLGLAGLGVCCLRLRQGDDVGAGVALVGLSLVGGWLLAPTAAEFEFLDRLNQFVLNPPMRWRVREVTRQERRPGGGGIVSEQ